MTDNATHQSQAGTSCLQNTFSMPSSEIHHSNLMPRLKLNHSKTMPSFKILFSMPT
jgi:hypothetical protein